MAIEHATDRLTAQTLIAAVKQLPPDELRKFARRFTALQKKNDKHMDKDARLLARVEENSRLPPVEQQRYEHLWRRCERGTLTEPELAEYQSLIQQMEARNVKRVAALIALAKHRGTTLRGIMADLGLQSTADAA